MSATTSEAELPPSYSDLTESPASLFPGVEVIDVGPGLSAEEFREFVSGLVIPKHVDMYGDEVEAKSAEPASDVEVLSRNRHTPNTPWKRENFWHADNLTSGPEIFGTAIYVKQAYGDVGGISIIDTALMYGVIEDIDPYLPDDLEGHDAVFSVGRYFREILPTYGSPEAITYAYESVGLASLSAAAALAEKENPPKAFPSVAEHPFRRSPVVVADQLGLSAYTGMSTAQSQEMIDEIGRYLSFSELSPTQREASPYLGTFEWEPGKVILIPQIGYVYRGEPKTVTEGAREGFKLTFS